MFRSFKFWIVNIRIYSIYISGLFEKISEASRMIYIGFLITVIIYNGFNNEGQVMDDPSLLISTKSYNRLLYLYHCSHNNGSMKNSPCVQCKDLCVLKNLQKYIRLSYKNSCVKFDALSIVIFSLKNKALRSESVK